MSVVSMKSLLESGVHFGHQTRRWNPKMGQFIFTARNGIHIIDLQKTMQRLRIAYNAMKEISEKGGNVLFVGTKKQARDAIVRHAKECGMFYVSERWLGGFLTNFHTVSRSIRRYKDLERMQETDQWDAETKKEILNLNRELTKKEKVLGGIKNITKLPDALFIIDPKREFIAVREAKKLRIPIFAVVDTNCNPDEIDYPIPGNDDAIRAIALFLEVMSRAIQEGVSVSQELEEAAYAAEEEEAEAAEENASEEAAEEVEAGDTAAVEAAPSVNDATAENPAEPTDDSTEKKAEAVADAPVEEDTKSESENTEAVSEEKSE